MVLISVTGSVDPRAIVQLEGLGQLKKTNDLIGIQTCNLPPCNTVPRPTCYCVPPQRGKENSELQNAITLKLDHIGMKKSCFSITHHSLRTSKISLKSKMGMSTAVFIWHGLILPSILMNRVDCRRKQQWPILKYRIATNTNEF
jgi:hypothetical protein